MLDFSPPSLSAYWYPSPELFFIPSVDLSPTPHTPKSAKYQLMFFLNHPAHVPSRNNHQSFPSPINCKPPRSLSNTSSWPFPNSTQVPASIFPIPRHPNHQMLILMVHTPTNTGANDEFTSQLQPRLSYRHLCGQELHELCLGKQLNSILWAIKSCNGLCFAFMALGTTTVVREGLMIKGILAPHCHVNLAILMAT